MKQNGDELTITDFKFIINHKADVRMLISTGHFICEPEGSIPPKNKVKCLMTGMLSVYTTGYEPMYAWLQMQFGQDFMSHDEWKNIIRENGYS